MAASGATATPFGSDPSGAYAATGATPLPIGGDPSGAYPVGRASRLPRSAIPSITDPTDYERSNPARHKKRNWYQVKHYEMDQFIYFGEVSVPGITNLFFSIVNMANAVYLFATGIGARSREFIADGALKFSAALITFVHAAAQTTVLLAPLIRKVDFLYQSMGKTLHMFIHLGGVVISVIEIACKAWQLKRQRDFEKLFHFDDVLCADFDLSSCNQSEAIPKLQAWKKQVVAAQADIVGFVGERRYKRIIKQMDLIEVRKGRHMVTNMRDLQKSMKRLWLNTNYQIMYEKFFSMSSDEDQDYINSFDNKTIGEERLTNHKLITIYRRIQCPEIAAELNNFLVPEPEDARPRFVTRANTAQAERLFTNIQKKSARIKLIHKVAIVGLVLIAISFTLMTAGVGTAVVAPALFWVGWTLNMGAGIVETCMLPCVQKTEKDPTINFRYLLPMSLRKKWWPTDPSATKHTSLPQRIDRKCQVRKARRNDLLRRAAHTGFPRHRTADSA